jgi:hypothetical protein
MTAPEPRWRFAILHKVPEVRRVRHVVGLPAEMSGSEPSLMGWPLVVILEDEGVDDHDAMLYRYDADGTYVGDTWHRTVADAKHQADFEYGDCLTPWMPIPVDVTTLDGAVAYALSRSQAERRLEP